MTITATVENGEVVLPPGTPWPDGTLVRIWRVVERKGIARKKKSKASSHRIVPQMESRASAKPS